MRTLTYDGSFGGWLSCVFAVYDNRWDDISAISANHDQENLFGPSRFVETNELKARRVWDGFSKRAGAAPAMKLYQAFLSGLPGVEIKLLHYVQYLLSAGAEAASDFSHPAVLFVNETAKKVHREKHRMEAFVRFRKTRDGLFFATVEPDFDVLPLISAHFSNRYADQQWLIYDRKRRYGLFYDLQSTAFVETDFAQDPLSPSVKTLLDESEDAYQDLWRNYFSNVNIKSRNNRKLHLRHMPVRYWRYLTEKNSK